MDFGSVKNVGASAKIVVNERIQNGEYINFTDFIKRVSKLGVNKKSIESLIRAGAFDELENNRKKLLESYEDIIEYFTKSNTSVMKDQTSMFEMFEEDDDKKDEVDHLYIDVKDMTEKEKLLDEKEMIGIYISGHPLTKIYDKLKNVVTFNSIDFVNLTGNAGNTENIIDENMEDEIEYSDEEEKITKFKDEDIIKTVGIINSVNKKISRKGNMICFVELEDIYGTMNLMIFESVYDKYKDIIKENNVVGIYGKLSIKEDEAIILVNNMTEVIKKQ